MHRIMPTSHVYFTMHSHADYYRYELKLWVPWIELLTQGNPALQNGNGSNDLYNKIQFTEASHLHAQLYF